MGYEHQRKVFKLLFADTEMEGLEVQVHSTSMGAILEMAELDNINSLKMTKEDMAKLRQVFEILSSNMVSWNLEEAGSPVGTSIDDLLAQDPEFIFSIIKAWTRAMTQVEVPLAKPSNDGGQFQEQSIPMESLSLSQVS